MQDLNGKTAAIAGVGSVFGQEHARLGAWLRMKPPLSGVCNVPMRAVASLAESQFHDLFLVSDQLLRRRESALMHASSCPLVAARGVPVA